LIQQLRQRLFDTRLPLVRGQMQQQQVFPIRSSWLLRQQSVIGTPEGQRRIQVRAVHVARERPRLTHQPVDHVPIVDAMVRLTTQPLHRLHQRFPVPHLDPLGADPRFHPLTSQPRRHRVSVLLHLDRAALAHPHPLALQRLQPPRRQRTQPRLLLLKLLGPARIPPGLQHTHELPVFFATAKVSAAAQQQFLFQGLLETPMALLAIAVLVAAVGVRGFGRHAVVAHQGLILRRVFLRVAVVMHRQRHAVGAVPLGCRAQFPQRCSQSLSARRSRIPAQILSGVLQ
jgi:hypothetical protein